MPSPAPRPRRFSGALERRTLPLYAAGELDLTRRVFGQDEHLARPTYWPEHSHPTHELVWHEQGTGTLTAGRRTWTISAGIGLLIPAGVPHEGWTPPNTQQSTAHFGVGTLDVGPVPVSVAITPLLRLLLRRLIAEELTPTSRDLTEAMVLDVLAPAAGELLVQIPDSPAIARIVQTLLDDPADPTPLSEWAAALGLSTRTITRAFEAETGLGFTRWRTAVRVNAAAGLLGQGREIVDVADAVGFRSASAFTTAFRRATGVTPGAFRNDA